MSGIADWKALARQSAHDAFSTPAVYRDADGVETAVRVRWHGKNILPNAPAGYPQSYDMAERVIFDRGELLAKLLDPQRNDTVTLTEFTRTAGQGGPLVLILDSREPYDGPVNLTWNVARDI